LTKFAQSHHLGVPEAPTAGGVREDDNHSFGAVCSSHGPGWDSACHLRARPRAQLDFELKAAEIVMNASSPAAARTKASVLWLAYRNKHQRCLASDWAQSGTRPPSGRLAFQASGPTRRIARHRLSHARGRRRCRADPSPAHVLVQACLRWHGASSRRRAISTAHSFCPQLVD
jgi:hypothetical protein